MPVVYLSAGTLASTTESDIDEIKIVKNISRPGVISTVSTATSGLIAKKRSVKPDAANITSGLSGTLKRNLKFPAGTLASATTTNIKFFLNASPAAPPQGVLYRADLSTLLGATAPRFKGSRLVKGDLVPMSFRVNGQKLDGLEAEFTAKRKDDPLAAAIVKSSLHQTDPVIDSQTKVETMMGSFALEPSDTSDFPDSEVELSYSVKFSDGLGRVYTIEIGSFTVYSAG
ncbi:hypothetical protein [Aulosira sp. FACHB-615]|uniref:hypothetical protein n=1 Tax=Aulosira sp. FACHB-615 TaxID=2692777 RepID=UPI0016858847|nr:hypothetical protein [Aulosira sp. FACHB-615]MBD2489028.1 hypothetical protein [Aulosira sp. FACHB-615]